MPSLNITKHTGLGHGMGSSVGTPGFPVVLKFGERWMYQSRSWANGHYATYLLNRILNRVGHSILNKRRMPLLTWLFLRSGGGAGGGGGGGGDSPLRDGHRVLNSEQLSL